MKYQYPECKTVDKTENWFGHELADPYAWLRDRNDPEVLDFVARENAWTDAYFEQKGDKLAGKIAQLKAEKLPELPRDLVPWRDGYLASMVVEGDYQLAVLDRKFQRTEILPEFETLKDCSVFGAEPCPRASEILAMRVLKPGAARPTVAVCNVESGKVLKEIDGVFSSCWSSGDGCLYYSSTEADAVTQESHSVFFRYDPLTDRETLVYQDEGYSVFGQVEASVDGTYVMATVCRDYALAVWIAIETATGKTLQLNQEPVEWKYIDTKEKAHYFVTVSEAANGAVIRVLGPDQVEVVLPESKDILDHGFSSGGKLFVLGCRDVSSCLICVDTGKETALPEAYASLELAGREGDSVFLKLESFVSAPRILRFDGMVMETVLSASSEEHPDLVVEQKFAPSTGDGELIPYYLVRRKDAVPGTCGPVLMYGYGGYNISMPPGYVEAVSQMQIPRWVENGGIYVNCNLRGGNEYGPRWHEAGMGKNKRHCYEDFIGIAEALIKDGWAEKGKIGIVGCSNGGLLMSTLVTMRPDLWGCVIDSVPHTDMIHFAEDDRGPMYITEYGNPRESKEMFEYLLSYSPYHNVRKTEYPPVYIQTGELDNNVPPYHGKKFAARMQAENQSDSPILLRVLAKGSHDRGQGEVFWKTIGEMHLFLEEHLKGE